MRKLIFGFFICLTSVSFAQNKKDLTLKEAVLEQYRSLAPKSIKDIKWIAYSTLFSFQSDDMQTLKVQNGKKVKDIITLSKLNAALGTELKHFYSLKWIDSENFIVSSGLKYYEFNLRTNKGSLLAELPEGAENIDLNINSKRISYTNGKSIYVIKEGKEKSIYIRRHEEIVSGQAIARSEFGITKGTFWSDKGNYLAFYEKDETNVSNYPLLDITTTPADLNSIKYPMAGQESEMARVGIYDFNNDKTIYLKTDDEEKDKYLTNVGWSPDEKFVFVAVVNRGQNHMKLNKYDVATGKLIKTLFEEKNDKWVEPETPPYFLTNRDFIWMSERDGFMNLYHYDIEGKLIKQLTKNKWIATEIIGYNKSKELFFTGTGDNPTEHHAFKVSVASGKQTKLTKEKGWHKIKFGTGSFIDEYSNITTPRVIQVVNQNGVLTNTILKAENPLDNYKVSTPELLTIKSADGSTDLHCRMIKPSNFNPNKKYPVLVYVYGGPHAQLVTNRWLGGASMWMYYQAEKDYIVFTVDNRGSANRGFAFESVIHRNLGEAEMEDQMQGVRYLKSLPYVNGNRLAVHGWSFGGYMTTSLMLKKPDVFNVGVAGGPVTDWKYYEVMYGERYMDTPLENPEGYENTRLHNYTKNLTGDLLLIHGTVDDVVVMQHNLSLVKSFVDNEIQMDFFPYPMHPHNVRGKDRVHLMEKVLKYVDENNVILRKSSVPDYKKVPVRNLKDKPLNR